MQNISYFEQSSNWSHSLVWWGTFSKFFSAMMMRRKQSVLLPKWTEKFSKVEIWMWKFQAGGHGQMLKMARTRQNCMYPEWDTIATLRVWKICSLSMLKLSMFTRCKTKIFASFTLTRNQELFPTFSSTGHPHLESCVPRPKVFFFFVKNLKPNFAWPNSLGALSARASSRSSTVPCQKSLPMTKTREKFVFHFILTPGVWPRFSDNSSHCQFTRRFVGSLGYFVEKVWSFWLSRGRTNHQEQSYWCVFGSSSSFWLVFLAFIKIDERYADRAVQSLNNCFFFGAQIKVQFSKQNDRRGDSDRSHQVFIRIGLLFVFKIDS